MSHKTLNLNKNPNFLSRIFFTWNIGIFVKKNCADILNKIIIPENISIKNLKISDEQILIWKYLYSIFWPQYILYGILILLSTVLKYGQPLALEFILDVLTNFDDKNMKKLATWMSVLVLSNFLASLTQNNYNYKIGVIRMKLRAIYIMKIFDTISQKKCNNNSDSGKICNLISNDIQNIEGFIQSFHEIFCIILQFIISFILLYRQIKMLFLLGVIYCILLFPVNYLIGKRINRYYKNILSISDLRIKNLKELLAGIVVIKINNWIEPFKNLYLSIRKNELKNLYAEKYTDAFCVVFWASSPSVITLISLSLYIYFYQELSITQALTSISIFYLLNYPINALSCSIIGIIRAIISGNRLSKFLRDGIYYKINDLTNQYSLENDGDTLVSFLNASFCFKTDLCKNKMLENISIKIKRDSCIGIFGFIGSGKTNFLKCLIGDMHLCSGIVYRNNFKISYVPQKPCLFSGTIRENILRGSIFNSSRYRNVLNVCSLQKDINSFPQKDFKDVGLRGDSLSGGQILRICLAGSIYQDADIYLFDDIFSSLDIKVANEIFHNCIENFLSKKAKIICSSNEYFAHKFDEKYFIEDKKLNDYYSFRDLYHDEKLKIDFNEKDKESFETNFIIEDETVEDKEADLEKFTLYKNVKFATYRKYIKYTPKYSIFIILISIFTYTAFQCATDWWITYWLDVEYRNQPNIFIFSDKITKSNQFIILYFFLSIITIILVIIRSFSFAYAFLEAGKKIHESMIDYLINAQFRYYEIVKPGLIINRFLADTFGIDEHIPFNLNIFLAFLFKFVGSMATICFVSPFFLIIIPIFIPFMFYIEYIYRKTSNFVKRVNTNSLEPIYQSISETFDNSHFIFVCKLSDWLKVRFENYLEKYIISSYAMLYISSTLNSIIGIVCFILQTFLMVTSMTILLYFSSYSNHIGLGITYSLSLGSIIFTLLTSFVESEKMIIHAENIFSFFKELSNFSNIQGQVIKNSIDNWDIKFKNVYLRYNNKHEIFPSGLNFEIPFGKKVGICGRTGSGKTSLIKLLFQIEYPSQGKIEFNNFDIACIEKYIFYSNMFLITQKPVIFSQDLRFNIDPTQKIPIYEIEEILRKTGFFDNYSNINLNSLIKINETLSDGLKQLIIVSRSLIHRPKILCLDEPTANMDIETEKKILEIIEREFENCTIIHISHKLHNLKNCDIIILLKDGIIFEIDSPQNLLSKESEFSNLMNLYSCIYILSFFNYVSYYHL